MDVFGRHFSVLLLLLLTFQKQINGEYQIIKLSYITCLIFILDNTKPINFIYNCTVTTLTMITDTKIFSLR